MKKTELSVFKTSWTCGFCLPSGGFALPRRQQLPTDTSESGRPKQMMQGQMQPSFRLMPFSMNSRLQVYDKVASVN